ncbi:uncharacterized protein LOC122198253 [Lactuca sativa]|uniref:uncharacterized protein LOC122198253 n=1 Tax=Lactuca sativa TaxID=4236 RepID=UPI001C68BD15|nr:uncharacterized protein LOC122198253 [Lactuca sativa]
MSPPNTYQWLKGLLNGDPPTISSVNPPPKTTFTKWAFQSVSNAMPPTISSWNKHQNTTSGATDSIYQTKTESNPPPTITQFNPHYTSGNPYTKILTETTAKPPSMTSWNARERTSGVIHCFIQK